MALSQPTPPARLVAESLRALTYAPGWRVVVRARGIMRVRACVDAIDALEVFSAAAEDAAGGGRPVRVYLIDPCDDVAAVVEIRG